MLLRNIFEDTPLVMTSGAGDGTNGQWRVPFSTNFMNYSLYFFGKEFFIVFL